MSSDISPAMLKAGFELAVRRIEARVRVLKLSDADAAALREAELELQSAFENLAAFNTHMDDIVWLDVSLVEGWTSMRCNARHSRISLPKAPALH